MNYKLHSRYYEWCYSNLKLISHRHVLMHLGEKLTNDEVNKLLEEVDPDRKGKIKLEPLCLYIMSK